MKRSKEPRNDRSVTPVGTTGAAASTADTDVPDLGAADVGAPVPGMPAAPRRAASGADFLQLDPAQAPPGGLATWLAARLRRAVADGLLPVGSRLPATRVLAEELRVSRGVVTDAYRRLAEEGQVEGRGRGGTIVVAAPLPPAREPLPPAREPLPGPQAPPGPGRDVPPGPGSLPGDRSDRSDRSDRGRRDVPSGRGPVPGHASAEGGRPERGRAVSSGSREPSPDGVASAGAPLTGAPSVGAPSVGVPPLGALSAVAPPAALFERDPVPETFEILRAAPARIDLSPGLPDLAAFPRAAWLRAERSVLDGLSAQDLGYGDPRGTRRLRAAVADWLARNRGIRADPDEVLIVSGTAQSLALIGRVFSGNGITEVAVEDPGSLGARQHLGHWLAATPPVPVDAEGLRVDALRATGAPAVLLTPAHQYPTGVVLGGARRRELIGWAREGGLIVEDDYDAEHRYDRPPVPALRSVLPDHVLYVGSVSKLLAPALRTGWLLAPPRHREALVAAKRFADLGNAVLPQLVLARLMESGDLEKHLRMLRRRHRHRRDAMIEAVAAHLPGATVHGAAAGLHLLLTLPPGHGCSDTELASAALSHGVKVQPLSWHARLPHPQGLVLGYAAAAPGAIVEGVALLGRLLRRAG